MADISNAVIRNLTDSDKTKYVYPRTLAQAVRVECKGDNLENVLQDVLSIPSMQIDSELSDSSEHPVQNKVVKAAIDEKSTVENSTTNGNIKIDGTETTVYTHPGSGTNPHGTTAADVGLGNVGNFKAVSTVALQGLTNDEKACARANIGALSNSVTHLEGDLATSLKGAANGVAELDENGKLPSGQLTEHSHEASTITAGTFSATNVVAATGTDYTTNRIRNSVFVTEDPGANASTSYANGSIIYVYE